MKKFFILLLAVAAVSFVGCSEDNGTDDDVRNDLLENSFWIYQESTSSVLWMEAVEFQKDGKCVYVYMERTGSSITDQGEAVGSYSYSTYRYLQRVYGRRDCYHEAHGRRR